MKKERIMVSVCTLTYNHAPFLRQCLDGILMQQTDFAFEILIHDDASTDGTQDIIREYEREYPDIVKPIYQTENQFSKGVKISATYQYPRAKGKYIALCEGDDYWTDPHKLQKQVDFLESHSNFVMCTHHCQYLEDSKNKLTCIAPFHIPKELYFDLDFFVSYIKWVTMPLSALFLRSALDLKTLGKCKNAKDVTLFYLLLKNGLGFLMKDSMGVYRIHSKGIWSGSSRQDRIVADLKTLRGILDVEQTKVAATFIENYLIKAGYLGFSFFKRNIGLYLYILINIKRIRGFEAMFRIMLKSLRYPF